MTVAELIAELSEMPQDATVMVASWNEPADRHEQDPAQDVCGGVKPNTVVIL